MRIRLIGAAILGFTAMAMTQTTSAPDLHLRGDRFKPLLYEELTPEQKTLVQHVLSSERGTLNGPFNVYLRSPEMGDLARKFGAYLRFHSSVPKELNELAILITARFWNTQYEWLAHHKYATDAGVRAQIIDAIAEGKKPSSMNPDEEAVYNFCTEFLSAHQVSDKTFEAVKKSLGEQGLVDLMATVGYYDFVSTVLIVDRYHYRRAPSLN